MIRHFVCTSFHLYSDTTYKVLLYLSMCAHRSRRQSNQLRSTSKSWEVCHAASASVSVPTWDLFQKEHVHPYRVRGFRVCPLSRWIYRGWDTLWWRRWGRDYVFLSVHVSLQPVAKSSSSEHLTVFFCVLVPVQPMFPWRPVCEHCSWFSLRAMPSGIHWSRDNWSGSVLC